MADTAHTIRLELRLEGDSPSGRATAVGGKARAFAGWMALVAAVDALVTGTPAGENEEEAHDVTVP